MPLATPPQLSTARSASTHSMLVLDRMDAHSPGAKPSDIRPPAISRTASAVWSQVQLSQQDGGAALAVDAQHDLENLLGELGGQAKAGLIQQEEFGVGHERTRDGQHLLLPAREQAGAPRGAPLQDGG